MSLVPVTRPLILIVDDDVVVARLLVQMLEEDGFAVEVAVDGAAAIARLGRRPSPDVLMTDLYLPHLDGVGVARFARTQRADVPVVLMTGHPGALDGMEDTFEPAFIVLTKPLEYEPLAQILRELTHAESSPAG